MFFGYTYSELAKIIYPIKNTPKYIEFEIPKKSGGSRTIHSPNKKLKDIQTILKNELYKIYKTKECVHGFSISKSIVTNAESHLNKKYILNIDLSDFFKSIHFGRIRNLFLSKPFNFNYAVSTILSQICCHENALPQGAPTSPILSNMIAWKMDSQLQNLAKKTNCTYTRYADDITFSLTCSKPKIPPDILIENEGSISIGHSIENIITKNGFKINYKKVRLCSRNSRMEVTGLTVNNFVNTRRQFIKQITSMLYAWEKFGLIEADREYNEKYRKPHQRNKSILYVIKGKIAFFNSVRTERDPIYTKIIKRYNALVDDKHKFRVYAPSNPELNAINSLWVIESGDNDEADYQGSGFLLNNVGIVTCAHVVSENKQILKNISAFKCTNPTETFKIKVNRICHHRDVAICEFVNDDAANPPPNNCIDKASTSANLQDKVKLLGFPAYSTGSSHYIADSKVAKTYLIGAIPMFEIDKMIRAGNSGGPILNTNFEVVGIATQGANKDTGNNGCLHISELEAVENYAKL